MKVINEYDCGGDPSKFPVMSLNDVIAAVPVNPVIKFEKLNAIQSIVSSTGRLLGTGSYSIDMNKEHVEKSVHHILNSNITPFIMEADDLDCINGVKVISPVKDGPCNYSITILEEYLNNSYLTKRHIASTFYSDDIRDRVFDYMDSKIKPRHGGAYEVVVSGDFIKHSKEGAHTIPMKWLCRYEHGNLLCDYQVGPDHILHRIDDYISENGLMDIFDRGLTIDF